MMILTSAHQERNFLMRDIEQTRILDVRLNFDPIAESDRICEFIQGEVKRRGAHGIVLGLSGGLDSSTCTYLCVRCLKPEQIHLYSLPERDSSPAIHSRAKAVARESSHPLEEQNISVFLQQIGIYDSLSKEDAANIPLLERSIHFLRRALQQPALYPWMQQYAFGERNGWRFRMRGRFFWPQVGNTLSFIHGKVRLRMLILSLKALSLDCLLICTTDRSEYSIGFYDPHGDGVGDIAPLRHLYKTQIRVLARALGVIDEVIQEPSSGDLSGGLPNETALGLSYEQLDRILAGLSSGMAVEEIAAGVGVRQSLVHSIQSACQLAEQRRNFPTGLGFHIHQ